MAVDPQSEGRNTLLVLAQFCPKCSEDVQADSHAEDCIKLVNQEPLAHTKRDLKLLSTAREKIKKGD